MPRLWRRRRPCTLAGVLADKGESSERRDLKVDRSAHQAMPGETAQHTIPINGQSWSPALSRGHAHVLPVRRRSPSSPASGGAMMKQQRRRQQQHKQLLFTLDTSPPACSTLQVIAGAPGDEGRPPVAPLPPPPAPHLGPPPALPHVRAVPDADVVERPHGDPGPDRGRDGIPDLTPGVEEGTEGPHPGGDATGHNHGPTTESERGIETGKGTETGDGTRHAGGPDRVPAHGRGAVQGEGLVGAVEAIDGETAGAAVPLSPPAAPTTVPPLTEETSPLPTPSVKS